MQIRHDGIQVFLTLLQITQRAVPLDCQHEIAIEI